MPASQDFRDGAATGAAIVAKRACQMLAWGVTLDDRTIDRLAEGVIYEFGGRVHAAAPVHPDDEFTPPAPQADGGGS